MTGPEHFRKAQELLDLATSHRIQHGPESPGAAAAVAQANVHALLALVAVQVDAVTGEVEPGEITGTSPWIEAIHR